MSTSARRRKVIASEKQRHPWIHGPFLRVWTPIMPGMNTHYFTAVSESVGFYQTPYRRK